MSFTGVVRYLRTFDTEKVERQEIHVKKTDAQGLPFVDDERIPIALVINGRQYAAGLRATTKNKYVWICPDLIDGDGAGVKLAQVLTAAGFTENQRVELTLSGTTISVCPSGS
jgi:hypothetical protein